MARDMWNIAEAGDQGIEEHKKVLLLRFLGAAINLQKAAANTQAAPPGAPPQAGQGPAVGQAPAPPPAPMAAAGTGPVSVPKAA
jgi:hypothetical protein